MNTQEEERNELVGWLALTKTWMRGTTDLIDVLSQRILTPIPKLPIVGTIGDKDDCFTRKTR